MRLIKHLPNMRGPGEFLSNRRPKYYVFSTQAIVELFKKGEELRAGLLFGEKSRREVLLTETTEIF